MNTKELIIYNSRQRQSIKRRHHRIINIQRILVITLQSECEMFSQMTALVITAEEVDLFGVIEFEGEEVKEALDGEVTAIDIIT